MFEWNHHDCDDGYPVTAPVGSFQPNAFGLHDILGNVWEWCEDIYSKDAYSKHEGNNPVNTNGGSDRIIRGAGWIFEPGVVRCANRLFSDPANHHYSIGFRLIRTR